MRSNSQSLKVNSSLVLEIELVGFKWGSMGRKIQWVISAGLSTTVYLLGYLVHYKQLPSKQSSRPARSRRDDCSQERRTEQLSCSSCGSMMIMDFIFADQKTQVDSHRRERPMNDASFMALRLSTGNIVPEFLVYIYASFSTIITTVLYW